MVVVHILIVAVILSTESGADIYIRTSHQQSTNLTAYNYDFGNSTSLDFSVKTCKTTNITLLNVDYNALFNIHINTNNISIQSESTQLNVTRAQNLLSCSSYEEYKVTWKDWNIEVMKKKSKEKWDTLLIQEAEDYSDSWIEHHGVYDISLLTFGNGEWIITETGTSITITHGLSYMTVPVDSFNIDYDTKSSAVFEIKSCLTVYLRLYGTTYDTINTKKTHKISLNRYTNNRYYLYASVTVKTNHGTAFFSKNRHESSPVHVGICDNYELYRISWKDGIHFYHYHDNEMRCLQKIDFPEFHHKLHQRMTLSGGQSSWKIHYRDKFSDSPNCTDFARTPAVPNQTESANQTDDDCVKVSYCVNNVNQNSSEIEQTITKLKTELTVTKAKTSNYIRSKTSAPDDRPSAAGIGYIGAVLLAIVFLGIVVLDIPNLLRGIKNVKRNLKR